MVPVPVAAAYFHEEMCEMKPPEGWQPKHSKDFYYPKVTVVASHEGQVARATQFRDVIRRLSHQDVELAFISKTKLKTGDRTYIPDVVGNVEGRKCILVDDIVNTGTTLQTNVSRLSELGADGIYAWSTHGVFGPPGSVKTIDKIDAIEGLQYLLISNSIMNSSKLPPKIRQLNIAPLMAEAIARALHNQPISGILNLEEMRGIERYDG
uniref:ribose-phosphate diphosphokinase n=1 Tax=Craspedostauros australis TaxID=1486917 RepID=A0A7R9ZK14_9STRA